MRWGKHLKVFKQFSNKFVINKLLFHLFQNTPSHRSPHAQLRITGTPWPTTSPTREDSKGANPATWPPALGSRVAGFPWR